MREIRTSGLMSGEGKRVASAIPRLSSTLLSFPCLLRVRNLIPTRVEVDSSPHAYGIDDARCCYRPESRRQRGLVLLAVVLTPPSKHRAKVTVQRHDVCMPWSSTRGPAGNSTSCQMVGPT